MAAIEYDEYKQKLLGMEPLLIFIVFNDCHILRLLLGNIS